MISYSFTRNKEKIHYQKCEICSKFKMKTPEWRHSGVFIANFEQSLHLLIVFLLLTLSMYLFAEITLSVLNARPRMSHFNPFMYNVVKWPNIL